METILWFIKMRVSDGRCQTSVSDPVPVGSPGFNLRHLSFLNKARTEDKKGQNDRKTWEKSLCIAETEKNDSDEGGADGPVSHHGRQPSSKKPKTDGGNGRTIGKKTDQSEQVCLVASLIGEQQAVDQDFMSVEKHGVVVPFFHQIEEEIGVLCAGRCGQIMKNKMARWICCIEGVCNGS